MDTYYPKRLFNSHFYLRENTSKFKTVTFVLLHFLQICHFLSV